MEDGDEDNLLLSSLGITSANPEDIERIVLSEAKRDPNLASELPGGSNAHEFDQDDGLSSTRRAKLYNRLKALEVEIDAVASTIQSAEDEHNTLDCSDITDDKVSDTIDASFQATARDLSLQHALAADRLKSLKQARAQLNKEISKLDDYDSKYDFAPVEQHEEMLLELVQENQKGKDKLEAPRQSKKESILQSKVVSYEDDADFDSVLDASTAGFTETERDKLVRKGLLTPFHNIKGFERRIQQPGPNVHEADEIDILSSASIAKVAKSISDIASARPSTKLLDAEALPKLEPPTQPFRRLRAPLKRSSSPESKEVGKSKRRQKKTRRPLPDKRWRKNNGEAKILLDESDEDVKGDLNASDGEEGTQDEVGNRHSVVLEGGLEIPSSIYTQLFDYQKVGVQWLWELHCQKTGGIIGDEMGLGKTVQVISYLGALHFTGKYKPSIVLCPVTLLRQWQREVGKWYPKFKVQILHDSAHGPNKKTTENSDDSDSDSETLLDSNTEGLRSTKLTKRWDNMIDRVSKSKSGLLLTTYEQLRILGEKLLDIRWGYAILDEGHRIRNPNAETTLICKQLQTVNRIIMTGAPIQNKLSELWSLYDFVFPGKLGVLPVFEAEFAVPITVGGYANATPLQVSTAYRCAVVLRDLIMPYLLRRMKADVNAQLPKKTEHVLFCSLTPEQRAVYRAFLASSEVEQIFDGNKNSLYGIDIMRKICNHPDLLEREQAAQNPDYGNPERSGKLKVVSQVLKSWKEQGHRVLLFSQTQQMLDILENFLSAYGYIYLRMDGVTPVKQRMALIDEFNNSDEVFIFILTTKVGGLGTNLTGANRVIIYDPDWNPSTDMQARERAWRIGQKRDVTVYRLITRGTIEEKVYHRQIYKHFLTDRILKNPQQKRFFKARDMKDLFTLQDDQEGVSTETSDIFSQISGEVKVGVEYNKGGDQGSLSSTSIVEEMSSPRIISSSEEKEKTTDNKSKPDGESNILKSLFDAHGIHSAVNHDAILNANDDDKVRMDEQASKVAERAAQALRESRMLRSRESFAVPTWTGRAGAAGAPSPARNRFGSTVNTRLVSSSTASEGSTSGNPGFSAGISSGRAISSSELFARIRGTQEMAVTDALEQELNMASTSNNQVRSQGDGRSRNPPSRSVVVQPEVLIRQLCTFIQQRDGHTDSASITQHFKDKLQSKDLPLFKSLLKEIAVLQRDANGSTWVLKPEYR